MARSKSSNGIMPGAVGAVAGTIIGAATGVLLSDRKTRNAVLSKLGDVKDYAQESFSAMNEMTQERRPQLARIGVKGGVSKIKSGVRKALKQSNTKKSKSRS